MFITPYLNNSDYLKDLRNIPHLDNILNILDFSIKGIWYNYDDNKDFILKDINPEEYLKNYQIIITFFNSNFKNLIYYNYSNLLIY